MATRDAKGHREPFSPRTLPFKISTVPFLVLGVLLFREWGERDILSLGVAGQSNLARQIVSSWSSSELANRRTGLSIGFLFIASYVIVLSGLTLWASDGYRSRAVRRLATPLMGAVLLAGALNLIEQGCLLGFLNDPSSDYWSRFAAAAAWPKLLLLFVISAYVMVGSLLRVRRFLQNIAPIENVETRPNHNAVISQDLPKPKESLLLSHDATPDWRAEDWAPEAGRIGICCSGGGIRSAAYNLGALQALQERGELYKARFLASVSGGSYIAAAFAMVENDTTDRSLIDEQAPYAQGSPEEQHLRNHSSYLANGFMGKLSLVARLGLGLMINILFVWLLLLLLSRPLGWLVGIRQLYPALGDGKIEVPSHLWLSAGWPVFAGLLVALGAVLRRYRKESTYENTVRVGNMFLALGGTLFVLLIALPVLGEGIPNLLRWLIEKIPGRTETSPIETRRILLILNAIGAGSLGAAAARVLVKQSGRFATLAVGLIFPLTIVITLALLVRDAAVKGTNGSFQIFGFNAGSEAWWTVGIALAVLVFYALSDATTWSMHPFYKRRLCSAFAVRRISPTDAECLHYDELNLMSSYRPKCSDIEHVCDPEVEHNHCAHRCTPFPEVVVCAAANITDEGATPTGRNSTTFTFSSNEIGGPDVGWIRPTEMETSLGVDRREDITLPAAVAISGAAISPAMGKKTRRGVGALLTLTNLRLGVWLPNPRWVQRASEAGITFRERPRASYLLKEIVGSFRRDDPFLYVTDGGHWENLGLVELLRRGCTEIYCFDASGDSVDTFFTLGEAVAIARTELGVEIRVNPEDLREVTQVRTQKGLFARSRRSSSADSSSATMPPVPGPSPTQSASVKGAGVKFKTEEISQEQDESEVKGRSDVFSFDDHTVAMFKYRDGTPGQIVFSKTAITMQAPWDVKAFAEKDPRFPTNSTADQLYTDERFEAYRALGWFTADHAVSSMRGRP